MGDALIPDSLGLLKEQNHPQIKGDRPLNYSLLSLGKHQRGNNNAKRNKDGKDWGRLRRITIVM